ncbi:MAG: hypothetical protein J0I20_27355 [Chloroflexi bacterium]|nr:hypothetical protein [Chloroflexota bacterium]OJV98327.1 MAG: hypothetical protein BGO39_16235 [Chloroflexi bacterium 54-19]
MAEAYQNFTTPFIKEPSAARKRPLDRVRLEWLTTPLAAWTVGGIFLDGWAHDHGKTDASFFTIWHGLLYSGFAVLTLVLVAALFINHGAGYSWKKALPAGYNLSLVGALVFGLGGVGDMIWHTLLGIEVSTEALLSPTHLTLALGITLLATGPLRAAWRALKTRNPGWLNLFPAFIALLLVYSMFNFFTQYAHPFVDLAGGSLRDTGLYRDTSDRYQVSAGVASILLQTALMMGFTLLALRRWNLPFGALTLLYTVNAALVVVFRDNYNLIPVALVTGLAADGLRLVLFSANRESEGRLRLFAFLVPTVMYGLYFLEIALFGQVLWSAPLWGGSIFLAGVTGLVVSYLVFQPEAARLEA